VQHRRPLERRFERLARRIAGQVDAGAVVVDDVVVRDVVAPPHEAEARGTVLVATGVSDATVLVALG